MLAHIVLFGLCACQVQARDGVRGGISSRQALLSPNSTSDDQIAVPPKVWPHKDTSVESDMTFDSATTDVSKAKMEEEADSAILGDQKDSKNKKVAAERTDMSSLPHMIGTWVLLLILTAVANKVMKGKNWTKEHRAPYWAALIMLWTIVVFATLFYLLSSHNWMWVECIYFCIVTVTTVGYGDFVPENTIADKLLLIFFLWFNMAVISVVLGIVVSASTAENKKETAKQELLKSSAILFGIVAGGICLFMWLESWTFIEALQFVTVTLTTVGYGHFLPSKTHFALTMCSLYILFGVPLTGVFVGKLGAVIDVHIKGDLKNANNKKKAMVYIGMILGWLLLGATGFHIFNTHNWDWVTCFYLAAVTMTTVGYGDFVPSRALTDHILVIVFIWLSVIIIATVIGDLNGMLIDAVTVNQNMHKAKAFRVQLAILGGFILVGIIGMQLLEAWGLLNGLVYTSVSLTTVGYGRLVPSNDAARLFAVPFLLIAVPMTGALVSNTSTKYQEEITSLVESDKL